VKEADPDAEVRALVARVTQAVAARAGRRADLAGIVAAEVAAALAASDARAPVARPAPAPPAPASGRGGNGGNGVSKRAVVTTTGKNARGIVAKIAQAIADAGGDILDISQTLVSDYFTMIIIVDTSGLAVSFAEFKANLVRAVAALGAECLVMHDDVVSALQRI
jgi:ACT domain-containing protein